MGLTGEISYEGKVIGHQEFDNGRSRVSFTIAYECGPDKEWMVPLSWFAHGLALLPQNQTRKTPTDLTFETCQDEIAEEYEGLRTLLEKLVKRYGHIPTFHKTDVDDWPSSLHGHDYDNV